ncbi:toxin glutamine deamidase domain-containing protein [Streptomyces sp. NPDC101227]|uniref:toxin glutamine deamidase domain-containing protein n=1 Tax=Streptomyces sp. NPDC101227 TaxID=3366136 RepID=UPI00380A77FB
MLNPPAAVEWVLEMLGFNWPTADEDKLLECAQVWRQFAADVAGHQATGAQLASNVLSANSGDSIEGFSKTWEKFSGGSGYFDDAQQAAEVIAFTFEAAAMLVIGMKIAVIVQLVILACEIAAAQAAAPFTLGLSEIGGAAATLATREVVKRLLREAAQQLLDAILEAAKEPVVSALQAIASDLIAQTINQNFGAQKGYDLGRTAKTGAKAFTDAVENTGETLGESLRDGAGHRAGHRARSGLDSAAGRGDHDGGDTGGDGDSSTGDGSGSSSRNNSTGGGGNSGDSGSNNSGSDSGSTSNDSGSGSGSASNDSGSGGNDSSAGGGSDRGGSDGGGSTTHTPRASDNAGTTGSGPNTSHQSDAPDTARTGTSPTSSGSPANGSEPAPHAPQAQPLPPQDQRSPFDEGFQGNDHNPSGPPNSTDTSHTPDATPDSGPTQDRGTTADSGPTPDPARPDSDPTATRPAPDTTPDASRPDADPIGTQPTRDTTPDTARPDADPVSTQPAHDNTPDSARPAPAPDPVNPQPAPDASPHQGGPSHPDAPQAPPASSPTPDPIPPAPGNPPTPGDTPNGPHDGTGTSNTHTNGDNSPTGSGRPTMPHVSTPPQGAPAHHTPSPGQPIQQRDPAPGNPMPTVDDPHNPTLDTESAGTATLPPPTQHTPDTTPNTPQQSQPTSPTPSPMTGTPGMPPQAGPTPTNTTPPRNAPSRGGTPSSGNRSSPSNRRPDGPQAIHDVTQQRRPERPAYNPRLDGPARGSEPRSGSNGAPRPDSTRPDSTTPHDNGRPDAARPDMPRPDETHPDSAPSGPSRDPGMPSPNTPHPNQQPQHPNYQQPYTNQPHPQNPYAQPPQPPQQQPIPHTSQTQQPHPQHPQTQHQPPQPPHPQQPQNQPVPNQQQPAPPPPSNALPTDAPHDLGRIRNDLQGGPLGLRPPYAIDQQLLADAVPRHPDGTPVRHPDPFQSWAQLQNDGGLVIPGRSNNCVDCSRSFLETWFGNPQVSAPRTWDTNPDGTPDRRSGERGGIANINRWANTPLRHSGGTTDGYARVAQDLQNAGHGAGSIIVVEWPDGSSHAFNAVNHNGKVVWVDTQSGMVSEQPIHTQGTKVWHLTLDANRQPYVPKPQQSAQPQQNQQQVPQNQQQTPHTQQNQQQPYSQHPQNQQPSPHQQPPHQPPPHQPNPYAQPPQQHAQPGPYSQQYHPPQQLPPYNQAPPQHYQQPYSPQQTQPPHHPVYQQGPHQPGTESQSGGATPARAETHSADVRPRHDTASQPADPGAAKKSHPPLPRPEGDSPLTLSGQNDRPTSDNPNERDYTDPHDRGESGTARDESKQPVSGNEAEGSPEYGLPPDALQQALREHLKEHGGVRRVSLDRVHSSIEQWAHDGSLANVLRDVAKTKRPDGTPNGPFILTRQSLTDALPGFSDLEHGEQLAVVTSMARLSLEVHSRHSVGMNPRKFTHPYRAEKEEAPEPGTKNSNAKNSKRSIGVRLHQSFGKKYLTNLFKKDPIPVQAKRHAPDFSGKNFAVLEVMGPEGITYVIDSSIPSNLPKVTPTHSEKHLLDWLDRANGRNPEEGNGVKSEGDGGGEQGKGSVENEKQEGKEKGSLYTPVGLYTEREPCGKGEGHAHCSEELLRLGKTVPVYYSTTYRTDEFGLELRDSVRKERDEVLAQVPGLSRQQAIDEIVRRKQDRFGEKTGRAAKALEGIADQDLAAVHAALVDVIKSDYKALVDKTRSKKESAMAAEFDRHIEFLEGVWNGELLSQLL